MNAHEHDNDHEHGDDHEHAFEWPEMLRIGFVAVAASCVWWRLWEPFPSVSLIGIAGLAVGGWPIFKEALLCGAPHNCTYVYRAVMWSGGSRV